MGRKGRIPVFTRVPAALAAVLLFGLALALYWASLRHPLVFDDHLLTQYALKTHYLEAAQRLGRRWLSDASFGVAHAMGAGVLGQRLLNVVLHAGAAFALFGLLARLFDAVAPGARARRLALVGAAWFTVHPVAVYGVAYLMERSILLATLFSLIALRCFLEGLLRRSSRWHAAAAIAYVLALMSKEHAVMVPAVAGAMALLVLGPTPALRRAGWALAALGIVAAVVIATKRDLLGAAYEPFTADIVDPARAYPLSVVNQGALFFRYLVTWLLPWPGWMSIDVRTALPASVFALPQSAGFVAWLAWPALAAWLLLRRGRLGLLGLALAWPWLLGLTEFAVARVQEPFVLYRSYLWMCGLPLALPAVVAFFPASSGKASTVRRWGWAAAALAGIVLVAVMQERLATFSSGLALWDDAVRKNAGSSAPYVERAFVNRGLAHMAAGRMHAAGDDFERAVALNARFADAYLARGTLRLRSRELEAAHEDLDRALALDAAYASAYNKRCVVRAGLGRSREALDDCERAVALDPWNEEAWINAGALQRTLGRAAAASASYQRALVIRPGSGSAHYNYGVLLMETGGSDAAVREHFNAACKVRIADACMLLQRMGKSRP